jgi:hypothetical protein
MDTRSSQYAGHVEVSCGSSFPLTSPQIKIMFPFCSIPYEGRLERHERWDGMRWTWAARKTREVACGRRSRVVLAPLGWC